MTSQSVNLLNSIKMQLIQYRNYMASPQAGPQAHDRSAISIMPRHVIHPDDRFEAFNSNDNEDFMLPIKNEDIGLGQFTRLKMSDIVELCELVKSEITDETMNIDFREIANRAQFATLTADDFVELYQIETNAHALPIHISLSLAIANNHYFADRVLEMIEDLGEDFVDRRVKITHNETVSSIPENAHYKTYNNPSADIFNFDFGLSPMTSYQGMRMHASRLVMYDVFRSIKEIWMEHATSETGENLAVATQHQLFEHYSNLLESIEGVEEVVFSTRSQETELESNFAQIHETMNGSEYGDEPRYSQAFDDDILHPQILDTRSKAQLSEHGRLRLNRKGRGTRDFDRSALTRDIHLARKQLRVQLRQGVLIDMQVKLSSKATGAQRRDLKNLLNLIQPQLLIDIMNVNANLNLTQTSTCVKQSPLTASISSFENLGKAMSFMVKTNVTGLLQDTSPHSGFRGKQVKVVNNNYPHLMSTLKPENDGRVSVKPSYASTFRNFDVTTLYSNVNPETKLPTMICTMHEPNAAYAPVVQARFI